MHKYKYINTELWWFTLWIKNMIEFDNLIYILVLMVNCVFVFMIMCYAKPYNFAAPI